jgi:hypothetical protein
MIRVEPHFVEAKEWHGLRRFRLSGLERVRAEALLIAARQNVKRLLSRQGWGRRAPVTDATGCAAQMTPFPLSAARGHFWDR